MASTGRWLAEQAAGSEEQVFVRLLSSNADVLLTSLPQSWGSYALEQLGSGEGWRIVPGARSDR